MREIRFRAWHRTRKLMCEVSHIDFKFLTAFLIAEGIAGELDFPYIELMQYTGLKDKKGVEIWHKNLITNGSRNGGNPHIVEWSNKKGAWVGVYRGLEYLIAEELEEIESVGSAYENPKLLE